MKYKTVESTVPLDEESLNQYAAEGWKLCDIVSYHWTANTNRAVYQYIWEMEDE